MKKFTFIFGVMTILAFSSCSKTKECKCIYTTNGTNQMESTMTIKEGKCSDMNSTISSGGFTATNTCTEL